MNKKQKSKIAAVFLGTIIEYYDYALYGFSAGIIAVKFFPNADPVISLLHAFAVYAVGYFSKPIGSLIFGSIGDLYGRKKALNITIIGIAVPTLVIGLLPEYSILGIWSTIILVLCRILQGIFSAGEYDGAAIYVIEHLGEKYKFTASAVTRAMGVIGLLLGIGATNLFSAHIFPDWGWRIPFLLSLPLSFITLYLRKKLDETPQFTEAQKEASEVTSLKKLVKKYWKNILSVIILAGGFGITYQISVILMKHYLPLILPQTTFVISTFSIILVLCFGVAMPISGIAADYIGPIRVIKLSTLGTVCAGMLLIAAINYQMLNLALSSCLMLTSFVASFNALAHGVIIKSFPIKARYRCISLGHNIGSMLTGPTNYICLFFIKEFNFTFFPIIYLISFSIVACLCFLTFDSKAQK